jgi:hypothetical protein
MAIDRTFYCEEPDCETHVSTATPAPYVPIGFIATHESEPGHVTIGA